MILWPIYWLGKEPLWDLGQLMCNYLVWLTRMLRAFSQEILNATGGSLIMMGQQNTSLILVRQIQVPWLRHGVWSIWTKSSVWWSHQLNLMTHKCHQAWAMPVDLLIALTLVMGHLVEIWMLGVMSLMHLTVTIREIISLIEPASFPMFQWSPKMIHQLEVANFR